MKRTVIKIHEDKCVGCGLCVNACHESALQLVDGKAKLVSEEYCDGLGNCLPSCPTDAIELIEKDAKEYNEEAVKKRKEKLMNKEEKKEKESTLEPLACGCPGHEAKTFDRNEEVANSPFKMANEEAFQMANHPVNKEEKKKEVQNKMRNKSFDQSSQLRQWPVQLKLINSRAPYLDNADLLIAADCTAYAYRNFHEEFIKDKITIIACPKLDDNDYNKEKIQEIIESKNINSTTVVRMEVPCCTGIVSAVKSAMLDAKTIGNYNEVTISTDGKKL